MRFHRLPGVEHRLNPHIHISSWADELAERLEGDLFGGFATVTVVHIKAQNLGYLGEKSSLNKEAQRCK